VKFILKIGIIVLSTLVLLEASATSAVEEMMVKNGIKSSHVSILIKNIKSGETLVSINPDVARKPASVMKVFTAYAALLDLGTGFMMNKISAFGLGTAI